MTFCTSRRGELELGEESTRTRDAFGVDGALASGVSKRR